MCLPNIFEDAQSEFGVEQMGKGIAFWQNLFFYFD